MATPFNLSIEKSEGTVTVSWSGGEPPYQLEACDVLGVNWTKLGLPTMTLSKSIPYNGGNQYFRAQQSVPLFDALLTEPQTTLLWLVPELA